MSSLKGVSSAAASVQGAPQLNPHGEDPLGARPSFAARLLRVVTLGTSLLSVLLAVAVSGCSADDGALGADSSSMASPDWGGQTGALMPALDPNRCGPIVGSDGTLTVLEDTSFVVGARSAISGSDAGAAALNGWLVRDAAGNSVELTAETLNQDSAETGEAPSGDTNIARPLDALPSGNYTLVSQCDGVERVTPLVVLAADPVPDPFFSSLSLSYQPGDYTCSSIKNVATLSFTLSPGALRFTDTTQLSLRNSTTHLVIAPWGSLLPQIAEQTLGIPLCSEEQPSDCLPQQEQMLEFVIEIVDQAMVPAPELLYVNGSCSPDVAIDGSPQPEPEPEPACALMSSTAHGRDVSVLVLLAGCALLLIRRRRSGAYSTGGSASGRGASI